MKQLFAGGEDVGYFAYYAGGCGFKSRRWLLKSRVISVAQWQSAYVPGSLVPRQKFLLSGEAREAPSRLQQ